MGKWFNQAREIERLQQEVQRQQTLITQLKERLGDDAADINEYGVADQERALVTEGQPIKAIKAYRERTGANLLTAKKAIDSVS
ncbi:hypothetical protein [Corynebacterium halotolerans]|uniref:hypothetical protein n=1 Tax=Corynebacterium halotolerans TaxID=225326 RepID=UPI003CEEDD2A